MGPFEESGADDEPSPIKVVRTYLALAIQIGAPAYNASDHRGCYEVYACTARLLLNAAPDGGADGAKARLRAALERCAVALDVNEQAWIMRRAFDAILDDVEDN